MKFIVTFAKDLTKYAIINAPNKTTAYNNARKYRDDVVINNYHDKLLSIEEHNNILNGTKVLENIFIDDHAFSNTIKEFICRRGVEDVNPLKIKCLPDDLEDALKKAVDKKGHLVTVDTGRGKETFFAKKKKQELVPILWIDKKFKELPKLTDDQKVQHVCENIELVIEEEIPKEDQQNYPNTSYQEIGPRITGGL